MSDYACGTCGDRTLMIGVVSDARTGDWVWEIRCGNGHEVMPVPGEEYRVTGTVAP